MRRIKLTQAMKTEAPTITGDTGAELRLPDYAAAFAVRLGNAVYVDEEPTVGPSRAELERREAEIQVGNLKKLSEPSSQSEPGEEPEEVKRPYGNAPKSAWIRYACSVDDKMTEERGDGMTKADLMSRYGERL